MKLFICLSAIFVEIVSLTIAVWMLDPRPDIPVPYIFGVLFGLTATLAGLILCVAVTQKQKTHRRGGSRTTLSRF